MNAIVSLKTSKERPMMKNAETEQKTAVIYCRQSFKHDSDNKSIGDQIAKAYEYAKSHNIHILNAPFVDEDTSSELYPYTNEARHIAALDKTFQGWLKNQLTPNRKKWKYDLGKCFDFIESNKVDYLIVWSFERLLRCEISSCLYAFTVDFLKANRVLLVETKDSSITNYNSSSDQLLSMIRSHVEYEGLKTKRQASMNIVKSRIDKSRSASNAYGVIKDKTTKIITFDHKKAEVIKYIFNAIYSGKTYAEILHTLNTKYFNFKTKKAKCFYESNIYHIAKNPTYVGLMPYKEDGVIKKKKAVNIPKPLINLELFNAVQKCMEERKNRIGKAHYSTTKERKSLPLSGLLYCGNCGSKLTVIYDKGRTFYRCHKYDILHHAKCKESRIRMHFENEYVGLYDVVQKLFLLSFIADLKTAYIIEKTNEEEQKIALEIENKSALLKDSFTVIEESGNIELFKDKVQEYTKSINALKIQLEELRASKKLDRKKLEKEVNELYEKLANGDNIPDDMYFSLTRKTLDRIIVYSDRIRIILQDKNAFELPRLNGKRQTKYLPSCEIRVQRIRGNGQYILDWRKKFHFYFKCPGNKNETKELCKGDKYYIYLQTFK